MERRSIAWTVALSTTVLIGTALVASGQESRQSPATVSPATEVALAIDQLRGVNINGLDPAALQALGSRLDGAIHVLFEHPEATRIAIRAELGREPVDSFLRIDLARVLVELESGAVPVLEEVAGPLAKVDPRADPDGFFVLATQMSRAQCAACLPAVLRMLQFDELRLHLEGEQRPVDLALALSTTVGRYGEEAVPDLLAALADPACTVRANAAYLFGVLLPAATPPALRAMATGDGCPTARVRAWTALGMLGDVELPRLAETTLGATTPPGELEATTILRALSLSSSPAAGALLDALSGDRSPAIAAVARKAAEAYQTAAFDVAKLRRRIGTAQPMERELLRNQLRSAAVTGSLSLKDDFDGLISRLSVEDLGLVNRARAATLSIGKSPGKEETAQAYLQLTTLARALRAVASGHGG